MMKLTSWAGGRAAFVNPKLVTDIVERTVRDASLDPPRGEGYKPAYRVEGCIISFGGPEDSSVAVLEAAEDVAVEVAYANGETYGDAQIVDVAERTARRLQATEEAEAKLREAREKCGPACTGCDACVPF